jgi:hypothetical protein
MRKARVAATILDQYQAYRRFKRTGFVYLSGKLGVSTDMAEPRRADIAALYG